MAFLVFEGLDGAGKSTLMKLLEEKLKERGHDVLMTREPGGTELGEQLRELILHFESDVPCSKSELLMYQAIRAQHVETKIQPALEQGTCVLCDRFTASSVAFQAGGRRITSEEVSWLNDFSTGGLAPDFWVLLDLSLEESQARLSGRGDKDRFELESRDFHERVRGSFLKMAHESPKDWLILDAGKKPEELLRLLSEELERRKWPNL